MRDGHGAAHSSLAIPNTHGIQPRAPRVPGNASGKVSVQGDGARSECEDAGTMARCLLVLVSCVRRWSAATRRHLVDTRSVASRTHDCPSDGRATDSRARSRHVQYECTLYTALQSGKPLCALTNMKK